MLKYDTRMEEKMVKKSEAGSLTLEDAISLAEKIEKWEKVVKESESKTSNPKTWNQTNYCRETKTTKRKYFGSVFNYEILIEAERTSEKSYKTDRWNEKGFEFRTSYFYYHSIYIFENKNEIFSYYHRLDGPISKLVSIIEPVATEKLT